MPACAYASLDTEAQENRLLSLQPGHFHDPIAFSIFHAPLVPPPTQPKPNRLTPEQLQKTVSDDWWVKEVLGGQ
jgi:hypothetical protein